MQLVSLPLNETANAPGCYSGANFNPQRADDAQAPARERASAPDLTSVFGALPAGVVVLDRDGKVAHCNESARALLGDPLQGQVWRKVIERSVDVGRSESGAVALQGGRLVRIDTRPLGEKGQVLLFHDVTEIHALQSRLAAQERAMTLGRLSASLAHQIRTPVSAALLYSELLKDDAVADTERLSYAAKIHERLNHVEVLTQQILSFVRGPRRCVQAVAPAAILDQLRELVATRCADDVARLEMRCESPLPELTGSADLLTTALFNLVSNAIQAGGPGTQVEVEVFAAAQPEAPDCPAVVFAVSDNGPGIAEELREHIFQPFFSTRESGNGLGLAVVRDVAHAHGGAVTCESTLGQGSIFKIFVTPRGKPVAHATSKTQEYQA